MLCLCMQMFGENLKSAKIEFVNDSKIKFSHRGVIVNSPLQTMIEILRL